MGSSCSRDSASAVDIGAVVPPHIASRTAHATPASTDNRPPGLLRQADGRSTQRSLLSRLRRSPSDDRLHRQQERELREIEQLQFELAAMEALFQSMLGQAFREQMGAAAANHEPSGGPPPASAQAVRQLATVVVTPDDLVEETNRECAVCFVDNHVGDRVVRLSCGHLFHRDCISRWLVKHCTCPVCRYELPTDDPHYERGRVERMALRRPRMRLHELQRMCPRELRELAFTRLNLSDRHDALTDRADLIDRIVKSGKVDIVASPQPIEYKLSDLRNMGVTNLKLAMSDAGVIFDPIEVVEKEDMVQMFIQSGRVMLVPEEKGKSRRSSSDCSWKLDGGNRKLSALEIEEKSMDSSGGSCRASFAVADTSVGAVACASNFSDGAVMMTEGADSGGNNINTGDLPASGEQ